MSKEEKQRYIWEKITDLYLDTVIPSDISYKYLDYVEHCSIKFGEGWEQISIKSYIKAHEYLEINLSNHEIIELNVWWENNT